MSSSSSVYRRGGEGFILHLYIFDSDATVDRAYLLNICERKLMSKCERKMGRFVFVLFSAEI